MLNEDCLKYLSAKVSFGEMRVNKNLNDYYKSQLSQKESIFNNEDITTCVCVFLGYDVLELGVCRYLRDVSRKFFIGLCQRDFSASFTKGHGLFPSYLKECVAKNSIQHAIFKVPYISTIHSNPIANILSIIMSPTYEYFINNSKYPVLKFDDKIVILGDGVQQKQFVVRKL